MTVTSVTKDQENLTFVLTAEFSAEPDRIWQLFDDPRQLERWWGPPGYPATFVDHDLREGGRVSYYMTGPEGEKYHGWWQVSKVVPASQIEFQDGFADDDGQPDPELPVTESKVEIDPVSSGTTRMTITSQFASVEAMEQLLAMGMEEGFVSAVAQIDDILAAPTSV
jgi:uncharacterized protein YndB with AHSA1/START domain